VVVGLKECQWEMECRQRKKLADCGWLVIETDEIKRRGRRWQVDPRAKWSFYSPFSWANLFYQMRCVTDKKCFFSVLCSKLIFRVCTTQNHTLVVCCRPKNQNISLNYDAFFTERYIHIASCINAWKYCREVAFIYINNGISG
jgi:hypothetical protein